MIFVTVGTTDFDALVRAVDELAPKLDEPIIAQIGRGAYEPRQIEYLRFAPTLDAYYERADLVIAHGGLGTLVEVMQRRLPLIGLSNPDRYDRHQDDLLSTWEAEGHMLWCRDLSQLGETIARARRYTFVPYHAPECHLAEDIRRYLGLA